MNLSTLIRPAFLINGNQREVNRIEILKRFDSFRPSFHVKVMGCGTVQAAYRFSVQFQNWAVYASVFFRSLKFFFFF